MAVLVFGTAMGAAVVHRHLGLAGVLEAQLTWAWFEALLIVVPSAMLAFTYADIDFDARTTLAAVAIALITGGVVIVGMLPLLVYLSVMTPATPLMTFGSLPPVVSFVAFIATFVRVGVAVDPSRRAARMIHASAAVMVLAFVLRSLSHAAVLEQLSSL